MHRSQGEALKVGPSQTVAMLLIYISLANGQKLEQELPRWTELQHQNILPLYGTIDIGTRLYLVSESSRVGQREIDSSPIGIANVRKWGSACLRQGNPPCG